MDILQALSNLLVPPAYASPEESYYSQGQAQTKKSEGFKSTPYMLRGIPHIGYGFNLEANPELPKKMTREQADPYFQNYYKDADALAMKFAGPKWGTLTDGQKTVLTDMAYNMNDGLMKFKKMRKAVQAGDTDQAGQEMVDSEYYSQTGRRAKRNVAMWGQ